MRRAHGVEQVRAAERQLMAALPEGELMQRAAAGLAAVCARLLGRCYGARVVLLVGSGDNGGDALLAGARLAGRGARVDALLVAGAGHAEGLAALLRAGGRTTGDPGAIDAADLVLDGIVGIGGRGALREGPAALAARAEASRATVVAVDLPSGVDADTGEVAGAAVRADVTVTFGTEKPGLLIDPGAGCAGVVELVDIGLDGHLPAPQAQVLQAADVAALLPRPGEESDKYRRGVLGVHAGSATYTGAAVLTTGAALRTGVGMVRFAASTPSAAAVRARWPEAVVTDVPEGDGDALLRAGRVQAWAAGPGMGTGEEAGRVLAAVLRADVPAVLDADALTVLAAGEGLLAGRGARTLLTPHAGELARLLGADRPDVEARRLASARAAASRLGATVLLKGSTTIVVAPDGRVRVNPTGSPWLATAGSGDVLTGACGALLAAGLDPFDAGSVGAWLHGMAGRLAGGGGPVTAFDVLEGLPAAIRGVLA